MKRTFFALLVLSSDKPFCAFAGVPLGPVVALDGGAFGGAFKNNMTPSFHAVPSAPQEPKAPENRLPAVWWPKVILGLILPITYTSQVKVILGNLELL